MKQLESGRNFKDSNFTPLWSIGLCLKLIPSCFGSLHPLCFGSLYPWPYYSDGVSESYRSFFSRRIYNVALDRIQDEPVIFLHGPRSAGKSTLLRQLAEYLSVPVVDLDDPLVRDAMSASPVNLMNESRPILLDEYQYVPEDLDAIKARLDREGSLPGSAVMTGSTRFDFLPRTARVLTGRLHLLNI